nr:Chain P, Mtb44*P2-Phe peptide variant (ARG-PHE-PRO-ALA-LYS-ALA-PRO-LEU-LEU) [Mycobacteriaceae]6GGM_Q Chain Q, Mtb44*P2-Phe peptide variant (ARG-PHE-PRO-ALA-LYS-ALA-PRO-LEU-LEU) [Mycobacteriaceae]
RFPAKAPLL